LAAAAMEPLRRLGGLAMLELISLLLSFLGFGAPELPDDEPAPTLQVGPEHVPGG